MDVWTEDGRWVGLWMCDVMWCWWDDEMMRWWDDEMIWWYDEMMEMMRWWDDEMRRWGDEEMRWWDDEMMRWCMMEERRRRGRRRRRRMRRRGLVPKNKNPTQRCGEQNYFTSSDPHRDIILEHIRHKFWHSFCPSVSRFHQNYPLLLVPSSGSGSSSDHCDLSSQTDSNWFSLCLIKNNFRRPGVSRRLGRRLGAWKLRFERYKTIWLSWYSGGYVSLQAPRRLEFNRDRSIETFFVTFLRAYLLRSFSDISSDILFWHIF